MIDQLPPFRALVAGSLLLLPVACAPDNEFVPPPPPEVTVAPPEQKDLQTWLEFPGTTAPFLRVEIRARVQGFLEKITFQPGQLVEKGDQLFVIDPKPFQAQVDRAQASVESAEAQQRLEEATVERMESITSGAVSEISKIEARAKRDVAIAAVAEAKARLEQAQLDLSYTDVRAPISGHISYNLRDVGNLVGQNEATLLATIVDDSKVYAWFNISEQELLLARKAREAGDTAKPTDMTKVPCELARMVDKGEWPFKGFLNYREPEVDQQTGTLRVRALFDNPVQRLDVGLFVRIRIPLDVVPGALLVPERALGSDQSGRFVLVVDAEDVVHKRMVTIGTAEDGMTQVVKGVRPGDRVVVNGLQRARPGAKVSPQGATAGKPSKSGG